jgi:hypothetical protein
MNCSAQLFNSYVGCNGEKVLPLSQTLYGKETAKYSKMANMTVDDQATLLNIPVDILQRMKAYSSLLRNKYPHWKPAKVQRKVAEHFKIKLT